MVISCPQGSVNLSRCLVLSTVVTMSLFSCAMAGVAATSGVAPRAQAMQAFTAVADDASAIYYNPAGLAQLTNRHLEGGAALILPRQNYTNLQEQSSSSRKTAVSPNLFYSQAANRFVWGVGLYAPIGRGTDYTTNTATLDLTHNSKLIRLDLVPSLGFWLTDDIMLGLGVVGSYTRFATNLFGIAEKSSAYSYGAQVGVLMQLPHAMRVGAVYRTGQIATLSGSGATQGVSAKYKANFNYPNILNLGWSWKATNQLTLAADIDAQFWSTLNNIQRNYQSPGLGNAPTNSQVEAKNSYNYRVGMNYRYHEKHEARLGYTYFKASIPGKNIMPGLPDYNYHAIAAGYSYYCQALRFDVGYEYNFGSHRNLGNFANTASVAGKYDLQLHYLKLGVAYQF